MNEIIESLNGLGYQGECLQLEVLDKALQSGLSSTTFRSVITWITAELSIFLNLDEQIGINSDLNEFNLELSSLLKEIACPYSTFISGPIANRFQTVEDRLLLLNFLTTELMAAKMNFSLTGDKKTVVEILESSKAIALKSITQNLNLGKPPHNIAPKAFFEKLINRFNEVKKNTDFGKPLLVPSKNLSYEQWKKLEKLQKDLDDEYDLRRQMLITRLDVTVQSFQWRDVKTNEDDIVQRYNTKRSQLDKLFCGKSDTDIPELLAARDDLAFIDKTSSAQVQRNTKIDIQKHIIGPVPDRGGRANEIAPPPPEMPPWQKNRSAGGGGGYHNMKPQPKRDNRDQRGGGNFYHQKRQQPQQQQQQQQQQYRNRGGGNNRVQGGWSQSGAGSFDYQDNYNRGQDNYNRGQDNYNRGYGGNQNNQGYNQNYNQGYQANQGEAYNRGQSNYNRGGRR